VEDANLDRRRERSGVWKPPLLHDYNLTPEIEKKLLMKQWIVTWRRGLRDESGLEVVEYAVLAGLITVASLVALSILGVWVTAQFRSVCGDVGP